MRNLILRSFAALVLLTGTMGTIVLPARAQDGDLSIGDTVSVTEDGVNLRDEASLDGDVVATLPIFSVLEIVDGPETADGYTWWEAEVSDEDSDYFGDSGWVADEFLIVEDVESPDPTETPDTGETPTATPDETDPEPTATSTPDDTSEFENVNWVTVVDGPLNLRDSFGLDGVILTTVPTNISATVIVGSTLEIADGYEWINVTTISGVTGWLATEFLDPLTTDPCTDGSCEPDTDNPLTDANAVEVIDGPVNVRASASLSGAVVVLAETGTIINVADSAHVVTANGYDWLTVEVEGDDAWVATDFVAASDESCTDSPCVPGDTNPDDPFADALGVEVTDGPLNVRSEPGLSGEIATTLSTGFIGQVDSRADLEQADGYTWIKIITSSGDSWVATDFLKALDSVPCEEGVCYPDELVPFFTATGAFVIEAPLNLRASPDTGADILLTLAEGDYLWIVSTVAPDPYESDGYFWIEVFVSGETGFVAIDFIEAAD